MKKYLNIKYFVFSIILSLIVLIPYYGENFIRGYDFFFSLMRIQNISDCINLKIFPTIYPTAYFNLGYASPLFYCDFFFYIPSLLYNIGLSLFDSYFILMLFACTFASYNMAITVNIIVKDKYLPYLASFLFMTNNFHLVDLYLISAYGEFIASAFTPLIILGIYQLLNSEKESWLILAIGFTFTLYSHVLSFSLFIGVFVFFLITHFNKIKSNKKIIKYIMFATICAILLSSWFLLPLLEMMNSDFYKVDTYSIRQLAEIKQYPFMNVYRISFSNLIKNTLDETLFLRTVGPLFICFPLLYLFTKKKNRFITTAFILNYLALLFTSTLINWDILPFKLNTIQYPSRFNVIIIVLVPIIVTYSIKNIKIKNILFTILSLLALTNFTYLLTTLKPANEDMIISKNQIEELMVIHSNWSNAWEYIPYVDTYEHWDKEISIKDEDLNEINIEFVKTGLDLNFKTNQSIKNNTYIVPMIYYKGYKCYVTNNNKDIITELKIDKDQQSALIKVYAEEYTNDNIFITYKKSIIQNLSFIISLISWIIVIFFRKKIINKF